MPDETITTLQKLLEVFMHRSMKNFISYLKERDLSMSHAGALFLLHRRGACAVSEIGESLGITAAGTSQMLNRLVDNGLIERSEDDQDRRMKRIVLTHNGQAVLQESIRARQNWLHHLVESLNPQERETVTEALEILLEKSRLADEVQVSTHL